MRLPHFPGLTGSGNSASRTDLNLRNPGSGWSGRRADRARPAKTRKETISMSKRKTLPYASELFGIYQPLLGWKSNQAKKRVEDERCKVMSALLLEVGRDAIFDQN